MKNKKSIIKSSAGVIFSSLLAINLTANAAMYDPLGEEEKSEQLFTNLPDFESTQTQSFDLNLTDNKALKNQVIKYFQANDLDNAILSLEEIVLTEKNNEKINELLIFSYLKQKNYNKAERKINELIKETPQRAYLYNLKATIEIYKGHKDLAIVAFKEAIKLDESNIQAYEGLAKIAVFEKDWAKANDYYKKTLDINDTRASTYIALAKIAEKQKKDADIERYLLSAFKSVSGNFDQELAIAAVLSRFYKKLDQPGKLLDFAQKLVVKYPENNNVLEFLAGAQAYNDRNDLAEATLRQIIAKDKKDTVYRYKLVYLISQQEDRQKDVVKLLDELSEISPESSAPLALKARYFMRRKQYDQVQNTAKVARKKFPGLALADVIEGDVYIAQERFDKAVASYKKAYQLQADSKLLLVISSLLVMQEKQDIAIKLLNDALKKNPQEDDLKFALGNLYLEQGDYARAKQQYHAVLKGNPENVLILNNLAWVYSLENNPDALSYAEKAYTLSPDAVGILDTYGYTLLKQGETTKGLSLLERAAKLAPKDDAIKYHLAKAYFTNGNKKLALSLLQQIEKSPQKFSEKDDALALLKKLSQ